jgi:histidyl-tRNA synthetase
MGAKASAKALQLARDWWTQGLSVQVDTRSAGLKKALATANRQGFTLALILGDGELERNVVAAKHLDTGVQEEWSLDELSQRLN